jgi:aminocarboxymuconate-semialdehyde decarboxylase
MTPGPGATATWVRPVVDIHAHVVVPEAAELAAPYFERAKDPFMRYGGPSTAYNDSLAPQLVPLLTDPALRLAEMDRQGVDIQAVSIAPPQYHYWAEPALALEIAVAQNDGIAALVAKHSGRLAGLGTLPMQSPDRAVDELERVVTRHGFRGVAINPSAEGRDYDEPAYEPFWSAAEATGIVVVLHPNGFSDGARLTEHYMINVVGNPMETTVALSHLVLGGVLERHPDLRIVAVHGGGYLPFYSDRMDHAYTCRPEVREHISRPPSTYLRQVFFDSIVHGAGLARLVDLVGADHVLLGTDYPFDMGERDPVGRITAVPDLSPEERDAILGGTAAKVLRLASSAGREVA